MKAKRDEAKRVTKRRDTIPVELKRAVLLEAGYRCAIPTCRYPTTEVAHIIPYAEVKKHEFHNLIALCPNCHTRFDRGEIDLMAMQAYKRNLPIVASRYNDMERRMLAELGVAKRAGNPDPVILVPGGSQFTYFMAIRDGLLEYFSASFAQSGTPFSGPDGKQIMVETIGACKLTKAGEEFANRWLQGKEIG